jgi:hypothetical protein
MGHEVIKETVSISMRLSLRVTDDQHGRCGEYVSFGENLRLSGSNRAARENAAEVSDQVQAHWGHSYGKCSTWRAAPLVQHFSSQLQNPSLVTGI